MLNNEEYITCALSADKEKELAALFKAMAHPMRVRLMQYMNQYGNASGWVCNDLVKKLPLAQSTVSEHLRILRESGLLIREIHGQNSRYRINQETFSQLKYLLGEL